MIQSFKHKGLQDFFETGNTRGINPQWKKRLDARLLILNDAQQIEDMDVPGWDLHPLKGDRAGTWAVKVTHNYRMTFGFEEGDAFDVDLEDYH